MNKHSPKPLISIGMPVYQGERYIQEAVNSILSQTLEDFELIISDNSSTDGTEEICRHFESKDPRVRYYRQKHNIGAARNFNFTFQVSNGPYFKWAAHDDTCAPQFLSRCLSELEKDPTVVLAFPKTIVIDSESKVIEYHAQNRLTDSESPLIRFYALLKMGRCFEIFGLIRRNALIQTELMPAHLHGDGVLLSKIALLGRFKEVDEYLFYQRRHAEQSSHMVASGKKPDFHGFVTWFDPRHRDTKIFPFWRLHYEWFRSIKKSNLSFYDKLRCLRKLLWWMNRRRSFLMNELHIYT